MSETSADRIQGFRSKAMELRDRAAELPASDLRQQFLDIAHQYDALATAIERRISRA